MGSVGETLGDIGYLHDHKRKQYFPREMGVHECIYFRGSGEVGKMLRDDMETLGNVRKMLGDVKKKQLR